MEAEGPRDGSSSSSILDWPGPHTVVIPRSESGFGFTLRHFVVYPPPSVLDGSKDLDDDDHNFYKDDAHLSRELSLEPQDTIFVKTVKKGSPADHAALNTGDRIIAVNGNSISGKSYHDVVVSIQQSTDILKLLVVPKDDDILQMAYQPQAGNCMYSSTPSLSDNFNYHHHHHTHSSSDIVLGAKEQGLVFNLGGNLPYDRNEVRHSYPLSQWGHQGDDFRLEDFPFDLQYHRAEPFMNDCHLNQVLTQSHSTQLQRPQSQEPGPGMASNIIPCKPKFSFGLYYPPKSSDDMASSMSTGGSRTVSAENMSRGYEDSLKQSTITKSHTFDQRPEALYRNKATDEGSSLTSSSRSPDLFIRYSSDRAATDNKNHYSPRSSGNKHYSVDNRPAYAIPRSQTVSTMSSSSTISGSDSSKPGSEHLIDASRSHQFNPVGSGNKQMRSEENVNKGSGLGGYGHSAHFSEQADPSSSPRTFMTRIPGDQQQSRLTKSSHTPAHPRFGLSHNLARSANANHIEIQKSIGKPIVSQRKYQFETGKNENTPPLGLGGFNRYKTEIDKIRTQPKFSSIAVRKASFEQSPDRDPPGYDEAVEPRKQPAGDYSRSITETSQPTVKVGRFSAERYISGSPQLSGDNVSYSSGSNYQDNVPMSISTSTGSSNVHSSAMSLTPGEELNRHTPPGDIGQSLYKNTTLKSYREGHSRGASHDSNADSSSGALVAGSDISTGSLADSGVWMKSSYHGSSDMLDAVDAVSAISDSGVFSVCSSSAADQEVSNVLTSRPTRKPSYLSAVNAPAHRMSANDSAVLLGHPDMLLDSQDSAEQGGANVILRKKLPESLEDQANKLHRRTSYLMATARDRTNTAPLEQTFHSPQVITDHSPQHSASSLHHYSSVKLNKFFGEMIPTITEGVETKPPDQEELPEIIRKGHLLCKISVIEGKKCSDRSWKPFYAILRPAELFLTRDKEGANAPSSVEDHHIPLKLCMVEFARDYAKKKKNVFRMSTHNECEYLFQTEDRGTLMCWIQGIKSINEPQKAEKMEELIASEREKLMQSLAEATVTSSKMSPQLGHKGKKLSALSFKSKLSSSPSMKRKKSHPVEKDKDESTKKGWMDRLPMMKSLKKHSEDSGIAEVVDTDKFQFGVPLEDCFPSPHNEYVPLIVELCTRIVEARGLEVVGVYRVPGNSAAVTALTEEFNRGIDSVNIDNEKLLDINVISSLLKSFFRKLPEPLIPTDAYDAFIEANRSQEENKRKLKLKRLLHLLPPNHSETFKHMAEHLNKVASYGHLNKMDAKNLAIMFGPTLVRKKGDDTVSLVTDMSDQCRIVESIILHHEWFFGQWDKDSHIPMETTVETVSVDESQTLSKDEDEEADSAISTKEIISSIVGAASKKLRQKQEQKSLESLDMVDSRSITSSSTFRDQSSDDSVYLTFTKSLASITSSLCASDEFLDQKSTVSSPRFIDTVRTRSKNEQGLKEFDFPDTSSCASSRYSRHLSGEFLQDRNDQLEISHGMPTSLNRDAISRLKRIGDDVSALLHTFEQKQQKEREHRKREQEMVEREHLRTQLELQQEENNSVEDWLVWKGNLTSTTMPDLVSSSYIGDKYALDQNHTNVASVTHDKWNQQEKAQWKVKQNADVSGYSGLNLAGSSAHKAAAIPAYEKTVQHSRGSRAGAHDDILGQNVGHDVPGTAVTRGPCQRRLQENQHRINHLVVDGETGHPASIRNSFGRRHGSLDSLIDMIDKQEKRASWTSSDSEDGSDLLTSITTTFDQKLQILLNPRYKLTGSTRRISRNEAPNLTSDGVGEVESLKTNDNVQPRQQPASANKKQVYTVAALLDPVGSFRDPSLHRSTKPDHQIGLNSRFELSDIGRTSSSVITPSSSITKPSSSITKPSSSITKPNLGQSHKDNLLNCKSFVDKVPSHPKDNLLNFKPFVDKVPSHPKDNLQNCKPFVDKVPSHPKDNLLNFKPFVDKVPSHPKDNLLNCKPFVDKVPSQLKDHSTVVLTKPKKLESNVSKANTASAKHAPRAVSKPRERERSPQLNVGETFLLRGYTTAGGDRLQEKDIESEHLGIRHRQRRHTVGGIEDFVHLNALSQVCSDTGVSGRSAGRDRLTAWEQLQPAVRDPAALGARNMQAWIQRERLRGSTPDLSRQKK